MNTFWVIHHQLARTSNLDQKLDILRQEITVDTDSTSGDYQDDDDLEELYPVIIEHLKCPEWADVPAPYLPIADDLVTVASDTIPKSYVFTKPLTTQAFILEVYAYAWYTARHNCFQLSYVWTII